MAKQKISKRTQLSGVRSKDFSMRKQRRELSRRQELKMDQKKVLMIYELLSKMIMIYMLFRVDRRSFIMIRLRRRSLTVNS